MRARLKPKLIQASMAKNRNKRHQPKNTVKLHKFPSGKSRKPEWETLGVTRLKKKMNQIKPQSKTMVSNPAERARCHSGNGEQRSHPICGDSELKNRTDHHIFLINKQQNIYMCRLPTKYKGLISRLPAAKPTATYRDGNKKTKPTGKYFSSCY